MCAIFGSTDKEKFIELAEQNQYRGKSSFSISMFVTSRYENYDNHSLIQHKLTHKKSGLFNAEAIERYTEDNPTHWITYYLGHVQAPTTDSDDIHPSEIVGDLLWHNGIIKDYQVTDWKRQYGMLDWDTGLLHRHFVLGGELDNIDGTFSWARYEYGPGALTLFRNEISPLYYDDNLNISSVEFENSHETESGVQYLMDIRRSELEPMKRFETKENPYYFG
jgi:hypothetical protein